MLYVGLDVHRRRTQVSVMDEDGHELFNRNVPNDRERLAEVLCGAEPGTPVVFESAYGWGWLAELLDDMGLEFWSGGSRWVVVRLKPQSSLHAPIGRQ
jgi:Transposase